jgi:protein TonB
MDFPLAIFHESPPRRRLYVALLASLMLHLSVSAFLTPGASGDAQPRSSAMMVATLLGKTRRPLPPVNDAPVDPEPPRDVADPSPVVDADADAESRQLAESGDAKPSPAVDLVVALGQRRLEANVPAYLSQPAVVHSPAGGWYFSRADLTVPPKLLNEPELPTAEMSAAGMAGRGGKVVLRVFVGADGAVDRVEVLKSNVSPAVEEAVVNAFSQVRFRPGEIEGVAVTSETRFEIPIEGMDTDGSHATDHVTLREANRRVSTAQATAPARGNGRPEGLAPGTSTPSKTAATP